jgi:hypothetical protein
VFTYLETNFFTCDGEYPSTLVSGLPTTAPPFASPPTLSHPTGRLHYLHSRYQQLQFSSSGTIGMLKETARQMENAKIKKR